MYYKVCGPNSNYKINEFENGKCDLTFIWEYDNYHKGFDWYNRDQEKEQQERDEKEEKEKCEKLQKEDKDCSDSDSDEEIVVKMIKKI